MDEKLFILEHFLPYRIVLAARKITLLTSKIVKKHGLNIAQWRVLAAISDQDGRQAISVVKVTPLDKPIVSRAIAKLEEMKLIESKICNNDKRCRNLYLTNEGREIYNKLHKEIIQLFDNISVTNVKKDDLTLFALVDEIYEENKA